MMEKRIALIILQFFLGLGVALAGTFVFWFVVYSIHIVFSIFNKLDYFGGAIITMVAGYSFMLVGIGFAVRWYLKINGRQKEFPRFMLQGLLGFILGITIFIPLILSTTFISINILLIFTPLIFTIIGVNIRLGNYTK